MAVRLIPNQLVKLFDTETLNQRNKRLTLDYRQYCQIVREEQTTMFQLQLLPDSETLIENGDFMDSIIDWDISFPSWQWASGRLQGQKTTAAGAAITQAVSVVANKTHQITLNAQFGQNSGHFRVIVTDLLGNIFASQDYLASDHGTTPFDIDFFFLPNTSSILIGLILIEDERDLIYIDDVALYSLTEPAVRLETCTGDLVETVPVFARAGQYITYAVDWVGKDEGCYRICIDGIDDTEKNYLDRALALATEGGAPIELEQGGYLKWFG